MSEVVIAVDGEALEASDFMEALEEELEIHMEEGVSASHLVSAMFVCIGNLLVEELGLEQGQSVFEQYAQHAVSSLWMVGMQPDRLN